METDIQHNSEFRRARRTRLLMMGVFLVAIMVAALGLTFLLRVSHRASRGAGTGTGPIPAVVHTAPATARMHEESVEGEGTIVPTPDVLVMPEQAGWVQEIRVKPKQRVRTNDVVAVIEPANNSAREAVEAYERLSEQLRTARTELPAVEISLTEAKASFTVTEARLAQANADLSTARNAEKRARSELSLAAQALDERNQEVERSETLLRQEALSKREVDDARQARSLAAAQEEHARLALESAQNGIEAAEKRTSSERQAMEAARSKVARIREQVRSTKERVKTLEADVQQIDLRIRTIRKYQQTVSLKSSADGVVSDVPASPGMLVTPAMVIARIARPGVALAVVDMPKSAASRLKTGGRAGVGALDQSKWIDANIATVSPVPNSQSIQTVVAFQDSKSVFKTGQKVKARIVLGRTRAFSVPKAAVVNSNRRKAVWVASGGNAHIRYVKTAATEGNNLLVTGGLQAGDEVILKSDKPLQEGLPVRAAG